MSRSLNIKLVFIILLIVVLLMTVVLAFLIRGVQDFYTQQFHLNVRQKLGKHPV